MELKILSNMGQISKMKLKFTARETQREKWIDITDFPKY